MTTKAIRRSKRVQSMKETETRKHHSNVRFLKRWCEEHNTICKNWNDAKSDDICVVSRSDYDLHEYRSNCVEDNESYFLKQEDYEQWAE